MKALVTGASRGLGLGICTVLAQRGDTVFAACRKTTPALNALGVRVIEDIDVASPTAVQNLRDGVGKEMLDVVISNAGINISFPYNSVETLDLEAVEREFRVNTIGMVRTVKATLPMLGKGAKIILITTSGGTLGRNPLRGGHYGYRMSKAGINTFGFLLSSELKSRGIAVRMISPGPVATDMLREITATRVKTAVPVDQSPDAVTAGRVVVSQIDELTLEDTGSWVDQTGKAWA